MRAADRPAVEVEAVIAAPPERVWALATDLDTPARFSSEFQGGDWVDPATGPALGARFVGRNRHPRVGEWSAPCTVVVCEPPGGPAPAVFAWDVGDPEQPAASWRFELHEAPGGTRLVQQGRLGCGPSGLTALIASRPDKEEAIVARRMDEWRANMQATVEGIKALAEVP